MLANLEAKNLTMKGTNMKDSWLTALACGNTFSGTFRETQKSLVEELDEARRQRADRWAEALEAEKMLLAAKNEDEETKAASDLDEALAAWGRWDRRVRDLETRFRR